MQQPDLTHAHWRKATRSQDSGDCVEIASLPDAIAVRDSKNLNGPTLAFTRAEWRSFSTRVKGRAR